MTDTNTQDIIASLLSAYGFDTQNDPNMVDTPRRMDGMFRELLASSFIDLEASVSSLFEAKFPCEFDEMVTITGIKCYGMCPHHFLTVYYNIDLAYIPKDYVLGLSKFPRLVKMLAARPVLQEQLTIDIVDRIVSGLNCNGAIVVVNGQHSCVEVRGIKAQGCGTITSAVRGVFAEDAAAKAEFMSLIKGN